MKNIVVTGAGGMVAGYIIEKLLEEKKNFVFAVSARPSICVEKYGRSDRLRICSNEELMSGKVVGDIDVLIHCAFTRNNAPEQVASSMSFAAQVFSFAKEHFAGRVFYTSTRSVYKEPEEGAWNTEDSPIVPAANIGIGKYGVELMLQLAFEGTKTSYCSLRLASVNELKTRDVMRRPINIFVENVIAGRPILVRGGMQVMSYVDPADIADAVEALLKLPAESLQTVYNIGAGEAGTAKLLTIAERVVSIGHEEFGYPTVNVEVEDCFVDQHAGLDITRVTRDTGWQPAIGLDDMIRNVYRLKTEIDKEARE